MAEVVAWGTVALGLVLSYLSIRSLFYFRRQQQLAGGSWLLGVFIRSTLTITAACIWLTLARAVTLVWGRQDWVSIISGLFVVLLLLLPPLKEREFRKHEGRADPRGQTLVEYGLLLALIAVIVLVAVMFLGDIVSRIFNDVGNSLR